MGWSLDSNFSWVIEHLVISTQVSISNMSQSYVHPYGPPLPGSSLPHGPQTPLSSPQSFIGVPGPAPPTVQIHQRRSMLKPIKRLFYQYWLLELIASFVSVSFLGMLFLILWNFDQRNVDDTGFYSTVPVGLVNSFTSTMRTAMLLPVANAIAQLRWSWFEKERELADMEIFESAAQGVWGSLLLLSQLRKRRFW